MISCSFNSLEAGTRFKFEDAFQIMEWNPEMTFRKSMTYQKLDNHHALETGDGLRHSIATSGIIHVNPYVSVVPEGFWEARDFYERQKKEQERKYEG